MAGELHTLEEALKRYLVEERIDSYNTAGSNSTKYNNLKLDMDPSQHSEPHLSVRLGISEALYSLDTGERLSCGLGGDERIIRRWIERGFIKSELNNIWADIIEFKPVVFTKEDFE
jgi:hypothetical protein